ncbi:MAG TPA: hypothetical protein VF669_16265 [Tepidisphaeraceae bacterium]|jgi:MYXO-CTERM domain-containing protein
MNKKNALAVVAAIAATGLVRTALAQVNPYAAVFDLRVHGSGAKEATVAQPGDMLTLDLFCSVAGTNGTATDDGLTAISGSIKSTFGALAGDLFALPVPPQFTHYQLGVHKDLDGDGDIDIGSNSLTNANADAYTVTGPTVLNPPVSGYLVGQFRFTAVSLSSDPTTVNFFPNPFINGATRQGNAATIKLDGIVVGLGPNDPRLHINPGVVIRTGSGGSPGGGTFSTTDTLNVGIGNAASDNIQFSSGTARINTANVGITAPGTITVTGGALNIGTLNLSTGSGIASTINVQGGSLSVGAQSFLGQSGVATINHIAGTVETNGIAALGSGSGGQGIYNLSGTGALNAAWLNVGTQGYGELNVTGGNAKIARLEVGRSTQSSLPLKGKINVSGGTLSSGTVFVSDTGTGKITQTGGTVNFTGQAYLRASSLDTQYDLQNGQLNSNYTYIGWRNNPILDPDKPGRMQQSGGVHSADHLAIGTSGAYVLSGGTLRINKDLRLKGTLDLAGSHATVIASTGSFLDFTAGTIVNADKANMIGEVDSLINFPAGYDPFTQIGHFLTDGLVHVGSDPLDIPPNHTVHGNGHIKGHVRNHGKVSPGNSPGAIDIDGDYIQDPTAALDIEIAGISSEAFDSLTLTGSASLAGTLNISLLDDFVPTPGDQFNIIASTGLAGRFDTINIAGGSFDVLYSPSGVTLANFSAVPEPAGAAMAAAGLLIAARVRRRR